MLATTAVTAAVCAAAVAAATPAEKRYVATLRTNYLPLRSAFLAASLPCQKHVLATCRSRIAATRSAATRLDRALARTQPPARVVRANKQLRRGARALAAWAARFVQKINAGKWEAAGCTCTAPSADVTNAIGEINSLLGVDLPILA